MLRTKRQLIGVGKNIEKELKRELRGQNHVLSRKTLNSIQSEVLELTNELQLRVSMDIVGSSLDTGTEKGKFPNFDKILAWVVERRLPRTASGRISRSKKIGFLQKQTAYRISKAIAEKGTPSTKSYRYSKNNRRKGFIAQALKKVNLNSLIDFDELLIDFIGKTLA